MHTLAVRSQLRLPGSTRCPHFAGHRSWHLQPVPYARAFNHRGVLGNLIALLSLYSNECKVGSNISVIFFNNRYVCRYPVSVDTFKIPAFWRRVYLDELDSIQFMSKDIDDKTGHLSRK